MLAAIFNRYRINLLLALLLAAAVIVLKISLISPITITIRLELVANAVSVIPLILLSSLGSIFFLDLDFLYFSFFTAPASPLSLGLRDLLAQKNYAGVLTYLNHHEDELTQPILRSALFQVILLILTGYLVSSQANLFGVTFSLGVLLQSILTGWQRKNKDWFWLLKNRPTSQVITIYFLTLSLAFLYLLSLLK